MSFTPTLPTNSYPDVELAWNDEFDKGLEKWYQDTFEEDDLHRAGYRHLTINGDIDYKLDGIKVPGRHAALMNKYRNKVQFTRNNLLVLKQYIDPVHNPYRNNFIGSDNKQKPMGNMIPYAPWLSTWTRKWSEKHKRHVTDWSKPVMTFGKGSIVETRVNFENQVMDGVRWSMWAMGATKGGQVDTPDNPAEVIAGTEYDSNPTVVEIDFPEVECPESHPDFGNLAFMKCIGGASKDTPPPIRENSAINAYDLKAHFGIDLRNGWHTFTLVWELDGTLRFYCDGILINTDYRGVNMNAYLIMSCEMCSGCKDPAHGNISPWENKSNGPKQPPDPGLSARCWIDSRKRVHHHEVLVEYVRVWNMPKGGYPAIKPVTPIPPPVINKKPVAPPVVTDPGLDETTDIRYLDLESKVIRLAALFESSEIRRAGLNKQVGILKGNLQKSMLLNKQYKEEMTALRAASMRLRKRESEHLAEMKVLRKQVANPVVTATHDAVGDAVMSKLDELLRRARNRGAK